MLQTALLAKKASISQPPDLVLCDSPRLLSAVTEIKASMSNDTTATRSARSRKSDRTRLTATHESSNPESSPGDAGRQGYAGPESADSIHVKLQERASAWLPRRP